MSSSLSGEQRQRAFDDRMRIEEVDRQKKAEREMVEQLQATRLPHTAQRTPSSHGS